MPKSNSLIARVLTAALSNGLCAEKACVDALRLDETVSRSACAMPGTTDPRTLPRDCCAAPHVPIPLNLLPSSVAKVLLSHACAPSRRSRPICFVRDYLSPPASRARALSGGGRAGHYRAPPRGWLFAIGGLGRISPVKGPCGGLPGCILRRRIRARARQQSQRRNGKI